MLFFVCIFFILHRLLFHHWHFHLKSTEKWIGQIMISMLGAARSCWWDDPKQVLLGLGFAVENCIWNYLILDIGRDEKNMVESPQKKGGGCA